MGYSETKCEIFNADDKTKLNVYEWIPKNNIRAVFLAIHGGMAHGGDFVTPALYFLEKGVATYAPDLRWHGTYPKYNTGGKVFFHVDSIDETTNDIHNLYLWIRKRHSSLPIFILCHSYGALVSLNYGLTAAKDDDISGFIVSSPWLKNIVQVPKALEIVAKVIARINPKFAITPKPLTDNLTHDSVITARHHEDERIGIRGTQGSASLIIELPKAQDFVIQNMKNCSIGRAR
jgi:alpha-beta hydrolase superfamily lysophospholipase